MKLSNEQVQVYLDSHPEEEIMVWRPGACVRAFPQFSEVREIVRQATIGGFALSIGVGEYGYLAWNPEDPGWILKGCRPKWLDLPE